MLLHKKQAKKRGTTTYILYQYGSEYHPEKQYSVPLRTIVGKISSFDGKMTIYSDSKVSRLLNTISKDQCIGFLDDWNVKRDHKSRVYVSYDSTNKNGEAGDIDIVEFGKARDDKIFPVFNLSIAMDKTNRIPLFYEEYPGSVIDVSQFTFMVDRVLEYGYKQIDFILDRGYFSKENICYIDENGYSFIIMCKGCKTLVSSLVIENRGTFETKREAAIRELEKIEMVRRNGRNYKLDHAVTRTQKLILNSFGLDETDIKKRAEEYDKLLNISQSYISKEVQDNGEEEDD